MIGYTNRALFNTFDEKLIPGDKLILYTDGIIEAKNKNNGLFGIHRFKDIISKNQIKTPQNIVSIIFKDVENFKGDIPT